MAACEFSGGSVAKRPERSTSAHCPGQQSNFYQALDRLVGGPIDYLQLHWRQGIAKAASKVLFMKRGELLPAPLDVTFDYKVEDRM